MITPERETSRGIPARRAAILLGIMLCVSSLGFTSCLWRSSGESDGFGKTDSIPTGLYVTAAIIPERGIIEKRFKVFLPDSGIVPIEVNIYNNTDNTLVIHTAHGLEAPESFHGFHLYSGGEEFTPIAPLDALAILMGEGKNIRYRKPGVMDAVVGIALPPVILVYGHREMMVGRRYRSLFKHSVYEATDGGAIVPVIIDPGAEISGFLYFYMHGYDNPYPTGGDDITGIDSARVAELTLDVRPTSVRTFDQPPGVEEWNDAVAAYMPDPWGGDAGAGPADPSSGSTFGCRGRKGVLFALPAGGKWRGGGLLAGRIPDVLVRGESAMIVLSEGISSKAGLVGAAARGDRAVCAVNFKASSRIYLLDISGPLELIEEIELDRKVRRVFLTDDAVLVGTYDDRCRYISLDGMKHRRNIKTGKRARDLFLDGEQLVVLGEKECSVYSVAPADPLRLIDRRSIPEGNRRFAGMEGDIVYIIHESGNAGRDTLAVYGRESFEEMGRLVLPASAGFAEIARQYLVLQLDGGTLLRVVFRRESREFEVEVIGHLPFDIALVERDDDDFAVLGKDGSTAAGDIVPLLAGEHVTSVPVGVKAPAVTSSRSRARR